MLIPSLYCNPRVITTSLSRRVNANSQLTMDDEGNTNQAYQEG